MTGIFDRQDDSPPNDTGAPAGPPQGTSAPVPGERAVVLAGFALAAFWTTVSAALGFGMQTAGAIWLAAVLWTVFASLACALLRGLRRGDWSAFRRHQPDCGRDERVDAATESGQYAFLEVDEEHERLMRGD